LDFKHNLTLVCPHCNSSQTFQSHVEQLICQACGWKGAFNLPVFAPKDGSINGKVSHRSFGERIRDITIQKTSRGYVISWYTFTWRSLLLILLVMAWGSLFFLIYEQIRLEPSNPNFMIFLLFHLLVWAAMGYATLALIINRATLTFDKKNMTRRHDPLPMWGEFEMPLEFIQLFYAEGLNDKSHEQLAVNKKPQKGEQAEMLLHAKADSYRLVAVLLSQREIPLFSHFTRPEIIYFLQDQVTAWLKETHAAEQL
jgi:hypothetical protein